MRSLAGVERACRAHAVADWWGDWPIGACGPGSRMSSTTTRPLAACPTRSSLDGRLVACCRRRSEPRWAPRSSSMKLSRPSTLDRDSIPAELLGPGRSRAYSRCPSSRSASRHGRKASMSPVACAVLCARPTSWVTRCSLEVWTWSGVLTKSCPGRWMGASGTRSPLHHSTS